MSIIAINDELKTIPFLYIENDPMLRAIIRHCKRCKTNEAQYGSLNCIKCNNRNEKNNAKLIADNKENNLHIKSLPIYGGLGRETDKFGFDYSAYIDD